MKKPKYREGRKFCPIFSCQPQRLDSAPSIRLGGAHSHPLHLLPVHSKRECVSSPASSGAPSGLRQHPELHTEIQAQDAGNELNIPRYGGPALAQPLMPMMLTELLTRRGNCCHVQRRKIKTTRKNDIDCVGSTIKRKRRTSYFMN